MERGRRGTRRGLTTDKPGSSGQPPPSPTGGWRPPSDRRATGLLSSHGSDPSAVGGERHAEERTESALYLQRLPSTDRETPRDSLPCQAASKTMPSSAIARRPPSLAA